jgi:glyoxylase-like metal-dependent hydrolase (beta-lactamase superfamily II)
MKIGEMQIDSLIDGEAAVDPEALYGGEQPPTEKDWEPYAKFLDPCTGQAINTIGSFLVRYDDRVILVDTGMGPQPGGQEIYACGALRSAFSAIGVSPTEVTDLVFSHLHTDHIGWTTIKGKPYFPNAVVHVDKGEWEHYTDPDYELEPWEPAGIRSDEDLVVNRFEPVRDRIQLFQPEKEILPGFTACEAAGHSFGHTVFELKSNGETGFLIGDLAHTQGELVEGWDLAFNYRSEQALESIDRWRKYLYDNEFPFAASHFPGMRWGRLVKGEAGAIAYEEI